jgi:hypothetical protein
MRERIVGIAASPYLGIVLLLLVELFVHLASARYTTLAGGVVAGHGFRYLLPVYASDGTTLSLLRLRLHHCRTVVCVGRSRKQAELAGIVGKVIGNQLACRSLSERFAYRAGTG